MIGRSDMRLVVKSPPSEPEDCLFSVLPPDEGFIPNCPFRCRELRVDPRTSFTDEPGETTCLLAQGHDCAYMETD